MTASNPATTPFAPLFAMLHESALRLAYWDAQQVLQLATPAWCEWFDLPRKHAQPGTPLTQLLNAPQWHALETALKSLHTQPTMHYEIRKRGADNSLRWAQVDLLQQRIAPNAEPCVLMVITETTEQRERVQVLNHLREQLDRHNNEPAAQTTRELERMRTLLNWRTQMLTERNDLLHLLSHEIRQPLNNASAAMQATMKAIETLDSPQTQSATSALLRAETVMQQVIGTLDNALAASSLLAEGHAAIARSESDLPTVVNLALHDIAADLRGRIRVVWSTETRTVQMHPTLMRLTLRNLLNNALAYSPAEGQIIFTIGESEEPLAIIIDVADHGSGIPESLRPRLFERGVRGENANVRHGAGLGLFIAKTVMTLHHGSIEALTNIPQGTIFRLTLPQGLVD